MNVTNEIKREIAIMKNLRHPNIVSLLEVIDDPSAKQVYLIQVNFSTQFYTFVYLTFCLLFINIYVIQT